jgi:hypothetical protein
MPQVRNASLVLQPAFYRLDVHSTPIRQVSAGDVCVKHGAA